MPFKKLHATVYGTVQGVGFRFFSQRTAKLIGITGWVKNNPDGSVEIMAVATENKIKEFILTLESGPRFGAVDKINKEFEDCDYNDFSSFEIMF